MFLANGFFSLSFFQIQAFRAEALDACDRGKMNREDEEDVAGPSLPLFCLERLPPPGEDEEEEEEEEGAF